MIFFAGTEKYGKVLQSNKMKTSMRNFTTDLRSVRQLAISQGKQVAISFKTGAAQRSYDWYLGDQSFNSVNWTPQTGPGRTRPTKYLDDIAYFRARPRWARYSDFRTADAKIIELAF